jgi:multidrug efflux pump subunit AcrB
VIERIRKEIGPIKGPEKFTIGGESRFGKKVAIMLTGDDLDQLKEAKDFIKEKMIGLGVLKDVVDNQPLGTQEIDFELKPKAFMLQLTPMEISRQVRQGFFGDEAQKLIIGEDEVRVYTRFPIPDRNSLGKFDNFRIKTLTGESYPLSELIDYKIQRGDVSIRHFGTRKEITIEADPNNPDAPVGELLTEIEDDILKPMQAQFPGVDFVFMGEAERARESQGPMGIVLVLTIVLVLLILALNFNSLLQGIIVMTVIPAGVMCAMLGHGLEGKPVSLFSAWGIIALIGILVNDAVVMVDTYNRYLREGMNTYDAAYEAGRSRFRPIVLTSVTTVVGLYPLIMEDSFQAQFLIPMAISVAHGLLWGTLFTMFFMPPMILFYNDVRRTWAWMWKGNTNPIIAFLLFIWMFIFHMLMIWVLFYVVGQYKNFMNWTWRRFNDIPTSVEVEPTFRSLKMEEKLLNENWDEAVK